MASPTESFAVIGGEGFVGQALVQELLKRYPSNPTASFGLTQRTFTAGYRFHRTDITSAESLAAALKASGATTVFHTASPHANASTEMCEAVNIRGTEAVLQGCRDAGVTKLVFTSTCTIVFEGKALINVDERMPVTKKRDVPYVWTKVSHCGVQTLGVALADSSFSTDYVRPRLRGSFWRRTASAVSSPARFDSPASSGEFVAPLGWLASLICISPTPPTLRFSSLHSPWLPLTDPATAKSSLA